MSSMISPERLIFWRKKVDTVGGWLCELSHLREQEELNGVVFVAFAMTAKHTIFENKKKRMNRWLNAAGWRNTFSIEKAVIQALQESYGVIYQLRGDAKELRTNAGEFFRVLNEETKDFQNSTFLGLIKEKLIEQRQNKLETLASKSRQRDIEENQTSLVCKCKASDKSSTKSSERRTSDPILTGTNQGSSSNSSSRSLEGKEPGRWESKNPCKSSTKPEDITIPTAESPATEGFHGVTFSYPVSPSGHLYGAKSKLQKVSSLFHHKGRFDTLHGKEIDRKFNL
jgi:hypothetical protein